MVYCAQLLACALFSPADIHICDLDRILQTSLTYANPRAPLLQRTCELLLELPLPESLWPNMCRGADDSSLLACQPCCLVHAVGSPVFQPGRGEATDPFDYVIAAPAQDMATKVRDLILHPPVEQLYEHLKETLIQRTKVSE